MEGGRKGRKKGGRKNESQEGKIRKGMLNTQTCYLLIGLLLKPISEGADSLMQVRGQWACE